MTYEQWLATNPPPPTKEWREAFYKAFEKVLKEDKYLEVNKD